ncbi:GAF domain-containing sensor histidine kinase [Candidatus Dojkabacteria bacterium]|uniref:histidine kinase n=1 Tax=Candidatus Dojkabacteria bacterium TaxID=2099670 RepID=A0A955L093_9BACT|nr:GAF domain-containing sensor histidine kinase [Candidatus Dojkabacteria bacterium]
MMFFLGSTAYAILRHRFLDIRVLIGRIVYYSLLAILPITTFFFLVIVYTDLFGTVFHPTVYFISIFVGIGFVMLFNKVNEVLRTQVDSRLINPGYNPLETTELLSGDLSLMIELQKINERVMQALTKTIRPDYSAIVLFGNKEHPEVRVYASDGKEINNQAQTLSQATKTLWESMGKHPIVQDEIDIEIEEGIYRNTQNIAKSVKESMLQIGGKVILTLGNKDNLVGMIIIGQKEADSPYTTTDIDFLKSVANTAGLAVERSLLYEEVQQFAATLQEKVDKATAALKKTNGDLEKALGELQEARRVERDMIDVMGHELRTPISIVRNALVMLEHQQGKAETVPKTELEKYLAMALESTRREITLIETLLSATKVDAARMQLYFEKVDFKDVVNDGMEGQKALADKKRIHLSCALPGEEIFVYADRTRIQEIMDNLLSNAIKYTLRGEVKVDIWQDEDFGWISVQDSGIGISDQDLQNLGKKFFRAKQYVPDNGVGEETKVVRPGGTGLGLYVTFDLINVMGGQLYINSKVGEGSKFTFSIPLYKDQKPKQVDQTFDPKTRDSKPHIFINQEVPAQSKQK